MFLIISNGEEEEDGTTILFLDLRERSAMNSMSIVETSENLSVLSMHADIRMKERIDIPL